VDDLLASVRESGDLGPFQQTFVARLETAKAAALDARDACAAGLRSDARAALGRVDRQMTVIRSRLRTRRARKLIPRDLASAVGEAARAMSTAVRVLRGSIVCP